MAYAAPVMDRGMMVLVRRGSDAPAGVTHLRAGVAWDAEAARHMPDFEPARAGRVYRKSNACPVNGDGYWYHRQEMINSAGIVCGSIARHDLPGGEL